MCDVYLYRLASGDGLGPGRDDRVQVFLRDMSSERRREQPRCESIGAI
jgi:hypothetical protein